MRSEDFRGQDYPNGLGYGQFYTKRPETEEPLERPVIRVDADEEVETDESFKFDGFQVVRSEFFSHLREPSITFNQGKIGVNASCLKKLPDVDFVQILINRETKTLVIRPCQESEVFSFQWCTYRARDQKRLPRQVTGKLFFMKLCTLMGWNPDYRYKVLGKLIRANNEYLFIFDLTAAETFIREQAEAGQRPRARTAPLYPSEWQDQFGIPFEDHQKALQVNLFEDYAIYGIKDKPPASPDRVQPHPTEQRSFISAS